MDTNKLKEFRRKATNEVRIRYDKNQCLYAISVLGITVGKQPKKDIAIKSLYAIRKSRVLELLEEEKRYYAIKEKHVFVERFNESFEPSCSNNAKFGTKEARHCVLISRMSNCTKEIFKCLKSRIGCKGNNCTNIKKEQ